MGPVTIWFVGRRERPADPATAHVLPETLVWTEMLPVVARRAPFFITASPTVAVCGVVLGGPMSMIAPLASTFPRANASAASTLAVPRGTKLPAKSPTMLLPLDEQPETTRPGWTVSSPAVAFPERAST
jgi:hypothetical protein